MARRHSLVPRVEAQIARYQTVNRENGRITILGAAALLALVIAAGVLWYVYGRSGHILDEALRGLPGPRRSVLPGRRRGLLPRHGSGPERSGRVVTRRDSRPQYVARLDRRERPALGSARRQQRGRGRFSEGRPRIRRSTAGLQPANGRRRTAGSISVSSTSRASRKPPGPIRSAGISGSTRGRPGARPIRSRTRRSIPVCSSARGAAR